MKAGALAAALAAVPEYFDVGVDIRALAREDPTVTTLVLADDEAHLIADLDDIQVDTLPAGSVVVLRLTETARTT